MNIFCIAYFKFFKRLISRAQNSVTLSYFFFISYYFFVVNSMLMLKSLFFCFCFFFHFLFMFSYTSCAKCTCTGRGKRTVRPKRNGILNFSCTFSLAKFAIYIKSLFDKILLHHPWIRFCRSWNRKLFLEFKRKKRRLKIVFIKNTKSKQRILVMYETLFSLLLIIKIIIFIP